MTADILIVSTMEISRWGGSETLWCQTAKHLAGEGLAVTVSIQRWKPRYWEVDELEQDYGIEVIERNGTTPKYTKALLSRLRPRLVLLSLGNSLEGSCWCQSCIAAGCHYALVVHAASEWLFPRDDEIEALHNAYKNADHIFYVSAATKRMVERQIGFIANSPTSVVQCPCGATHNEELPFPVLSDGLRMACVGRLEPEDKGQDIAIAVLSQKKWRRRNVSLSLFGSGTGEKLIRYLIDTHGHPRVTICGYEPNVGAIWRNHHILLLPSRAEGKPLSIIEAMLHGRVPAVTDVAGNTELVEDGRTGYVADFPRDKCVDRMLERLWSERANLPQIGNNAQQYAREYADPNPARTFAGSILRLLVERNRRASYI